MPIYTRLLPKLARLVDEWLEGTHVVPLAPQCVIIVSRYFFIRSCSHVSEQNHTPATADGA